MKLTIIGAGKMAEAIIGGALKDFEVEVVARDAKKLNALIEKYPKLKNGGVLDSPVDIENKNLLLCIKPNALESVGIYLDGEANSAISVLAGSSIDTLQKSIKAKYYVRAMPNLAACNQSSMTTLCGDKSFKDEAIKICESFGKTLWLSSEKEIDIATAVAGSGPAYLALVAEALSDGAVKEGLKRADAKALVEGLFSGFSTLLEGKHPAIIKDEVMSPGGTTAAGYSALEEGSVRDGFIKAVGKAYKRARG
jgi:pyrroline-5-carboxylate reductase